MLIESERILIRNWNIEKDTEAVFRMYSHPDVVRFLGRECLKNHQEAQEYIQRLINHTEGFGGKYGSWAITERSNDTLIGNILLKPIPGKDRILTEQIEIGWHLARPMWGQGYATEAAQTMVEHAFETLALNRLIAVTELENKASIAVMKRLGMSSLGPCRDFYDGLLLEVFEMYSYQSVPL